MTAIKVAEAQSELHSVRSTLGLFQRSVILEVYFARLDGRIPQIISAEIKPLYEIDLQLIKAYLLGQHPEDTILTRILKIMN